MLLKICVDHCVYKLRSWNIKKPKKVVSILRLRYSLKLAAELVTVGDEILKSH